MSGTDDPRETHAEPPLDFDGCHRACRKKGEHTLHEGCEFAPPPPPQMPVVWESFIADDGHPAIRTRDITWAEAAAMVGADADAMAARRTALAVAEASIYRDADETCECTPDGRCEHNGSPAAPRVVDVDSLATEIPDAAVLAVMEVMGWLDDRNDPGGDGQPPAACWTLATDIVRAAHGPLLAELDDAHRCAGAARAEADSDRRAYLVQVERLIAERNAARAEAERIAQDYDVLKREYEDKVPPTARAAGKNRPKEADGD